MHFSYINYAEKVNNGPRFEIYEDVYCTNRLILIQFILTSHFNLLKFGTIHTFVMHFQLCVNQAENVIKALV